MCGLWDGNAIECTWHASCNDSLFCWCVYALSYLPFSPQPHRSDSRLWIWYYDRQGVLLSEGIDFLQDFPRFLVLLLAFQRFELQDWGVIPILNQFSSQIHGALAADCEGRPGPTNDRKHRYKPKPTIDLDTKHIHTTFSSTDAAKAVQNIR